MHAGVMPNGRVIFLDKVENYTQIRLSDGQYAYSSEYDPITNTAVGLPYKVYSSPETAVILLKYFRQMPSVLEALSCPMVD
jgi:hypothetical protein